jgi:hypothetical protein
MGPGGSGCELGQASSGPMRRGLRRSRVGASCAGQRGDSWTQASGGVWADARRQALTCQEEAVRAVECGRAARLRRAEAGIEAKLAWSGKAEGGLARELGGGLHASWGKASEQVPAGWAALGGSRRMRIEVELWRGA